MDLLVVIGKTGHAMHTISHACPLGFPFPLIDPCPFSDDQLSSVFISMYRLSVLCQKAPFFWPIPLPVPLKDSLLKRRKFFSPNLRMTDLELSFIPFLWSSFRPVAY